MIKAVRNSLLFSRDLIFILPAILVGLTVHEFSHAFTSHQLGDPTPRFQGRVTLNPIAHIDPIGLIALLLFGFGWGNPVQIDDSYYENRKLGRIMVSLAGPGSNIVIAILAATAIHLLPMTSLWLLKLLSYLVIYNVVLAVFNLLPFPPLDGSKLLLEFLPPRVKFKYYYPLQQYFPFIMLLLLYTGLIRIIINPIIRFVIRDLLRLWFLA